jgi:hypothetical protein
MLTNAWPPLTPNQSLLIAQVRNVLPEGFSLGANDFQLLGYIMIVIQDFNIWPVQTFFTADTVVQDPAASQIVVFGCCVFAALFQQMNASIQDFSFSDQGFTVQVDQTAKIQQSISNMMEVYKTMIKAYKVNLICSQGPVGLGSPRYQSQLGQFLKIALGSAFTWNSP